MTGTFLFIKFMKPIFAYIRVSTQKQGQLGVSLQEQRTAIERYAQKQGLSVARWFEERETAAKRGRPIFAQMLKELRQGRARGVIMHKIDRSARNLRDWADLRELADSGIEAHFASEGLDLQTRDRRLSADVQAVVAAAYIDNLREEARKGFYGRLKQGVLPLPAPIGYLDKGAGKPKAPNPTVAPLILKGFELYATGKYSITTLRDELHNLGLRSRRGGNLHRSGIAKLLNNPFYIGLIRIHKTKETFRGAHPPIISAQLFQRVQDILTGRTATTNVRRQYLFRKLLKCAVCSYSLVGDYKKGNVYYRCWRGECVSNSVREDLVEDAIVKTLANVQILPHELDELREAVEHLMGDHTRQQEDLRNTLVLHAANLRRRRARLVDAFLDEVIDKNDFEHRRSTLLQDEVLLTEKQQRIGEQPDASRSRLERYFELLKTAQSAYISAFPEEKRKLLSEITSNFTVSQKSIEITLRFPFSLIADREKVQSVDRIGTYFELLARDLVRSSYGLSADPPGDASAAETLIHH